MSLVVNMQQRRTVAAGRQNQDPNKDVAPKKEQTPKKLSLNVERNIQEVLNHKGNTTGRGRHMVLAHLEKKKASEERTPPAAMNKLLGGSAKTGGYSGVTRSAVEPLGNKLSTPNLRKRRLNPEESRVFLSALHASQQEEPERDFTDLAPGSPVKTSAKEGMAVYTKRPKTGTTPPTPPLRSLSRRRVAPPSPCPAPPPVFESRSEKVSSPEASMPVVEQAAELDNLQPVRRQLISPPITEDSDPYGFASVRDSVEDVNALALWKDPDTEALGVDNQSYSFLPQSPRKSHGLMNLGNTCYMNVIVQCLYNLSSFVSGMERFFGPLVKQKALEDSELLLSSDVETVHAALLKVFRDLRQAERYEVVNPSVLKHMFAKHQESFWGCMQQDAHEFFCSLIDQVQEDVSSELKKQYSIEADRPKLEDVCPTTQNFSCSVRNNLTCAGCGNVSSVEETYRDFCLAFPEGERADESQNCSLESLLNLYFQETSMSRKCEKCGVEDTKAQAQILKLPHVLVLQLKRLHMDRDVPCTKVSAPVKFTSRLDVGPWCSLDKQKFWSPAPEDFKSNEPVTTTHVTQHGGSNFGLPSCFEFESPKLNAKLKKSADVSSYRLHGVVNHLGFNASGGHFLTDVYDAEADRWLRCDDSLVTDVSEESVLANARGAYMFFYVHESVTEDLR